MRIYGLFDPKRRKEIKDGLKKGKIPPRERPSLPQPNPSNPADQKILDNRLLVAVQDLESLEIIEAILRDGANVNAHKDDDGRCGSGRTPLMIAAVHLEVELIKLLLTWKADVHYRNRAGEDIMSIIGFIVRTCPPNDAKQNKKIDEVLDVLSYGHPQKS